MKWLIVVVVVLFAAGLPGFLLAGPMGAGAAVLAVIAVEVIRRVVVHSQAAAVDRRAASPSATGCDK